MARPRTTTKGIDLAERARFYRVDEMTIRRWITAGADPYDVESVGNLLLRQKNPKTATLEKLTTELSHE